MPKSVWFAASHASLFHPGTGSHYIDLVPAGVAPTSHQQIAALMAGAGHSIAHQASSHAAFQAANGGDTNYILVSTSFASESAEDLWHAHPSVAILPHPTFEGNDPIAQHAGARAKHIQQAHLDALASHPTLGYLPGDTVLELSRKAALLHPQVKLRHIL